MKTTLELKTQLEDSKKLSGEPREKCLLGILSDIREIESAAAKDPNFPLTKILEAQKFVPEVQASLNRVQSALRRKTLQENSSLK